MTISYLLAAMSAAKTNPEMLFPTGDWVSPTLTAEEYRKWFMGCLNAKINSKLPAVLRTGRKHSNDYQSGLTVDRQMIDNALRLRVYRSGRNLLRTPELARRYPEINTRMFE